MSSLDQMDADPFPAVYKDVRCPRCNKNYSEGDRTPLLLLCGHAVCERCYGKSNQLVCGVCNEETVLAAGEEKSKHFYTYGLIHDTCSKSRGHGSRTRARKLVDNVLRKSAINKLLIKDPCDECLLSKATVQCRQCWIEVCLPCFNKCKMAS
ncbi:uncharacterized protein LOC135225366 [Macrobrachium nipponense]|uniref:uncharacterized protein LOC135225366 n=1 Tax=Macrobrachium nipponense TaxID=159736 RepID=UPI0030C8CA4D